MHRLYLPLFQYIAVSRSLFASGPFRLIKETYDFPLHRLGLQSESAFLIPEGGDMVIEDVLERNLAFLQFALIENCEICPSFVDVLDLFHHLVFALLGFNYHVLDFKGGLFALELAF